jgi:hypothetical protein
MLNSFNYRIEETEHTGPNTWKLGLKIEQLTDFQKASLLPDLESQKHNNDVWTRQMIDVQKKMVRRYK